MSFHNQHDFQPEPEPLTPFVGLDELHMRTPDAPRDKSERAFANVMLYVAASLLALLHDDRNHVRRIVLSKNAQRRRRGEMPIPPLWRVPPGYLARVTRPAEPPSPGRRPRLAVEIAGHFRRNAAFYAGAARP